MHQPVAEVVQRGDQPVTEQSSIEVLYDIDNGKRSSS